VAEHTRHLKVITQYWKLGGRTKKQKLSGFQGGKKRSVVPTRRTLPGLFKYQKLSQKKTKKKKKEKRGKRPRMEKAKYEVNLSARKTTLTTSVSMVNYGNSPSGKRAWQKKNLGGKGRQGFGNCGQRGGIKERTDTTAADRSTLTGGKKDGGETKNTGKQEGLTQQRRWTVKNR